MNERLERAIAAFDRENARDPNREQGQPRELVQAERLARWVSRLEPNASEALRLAARCQHLRRWEIPRSDFPEGRAGYLQWRTRLARFHADEAERILRGIGYADDVVSEVRKINLKHGMKSDSDVQTMEDALCLSFIEHGLAAFADKHADEKIVEILKKTWKKMSPRAHALAGELAPKLGPRLETLLSAALARAE